jgi:hypothetical protein
MRIIFVPQYPTQTRYQEWWFWKFPEEFEKAGYEVITLGKDYANMMECRRGGLDMFTPVNMAIELETQQIREFMLLDLTDDDVLFLADLSFPGFFSNVLYHKRCPKMFAFCHATSLNKFDYFEDVREVKFPVETTHARMFDKIFVGSKYHANKLKWDNVVTTYLPASPFRTFKEEKIYNLVSVGRPTKQKIDKILEENINSGVCRIYRKMSNTWESYYKFLSMSKILLISSHEDTFNYTILEALMNNTIVLAPNRLCFPELLPDDYLYNNYDDLKSKILIYLKDYKLVPKIKCEKHIENFFKKIINYIMWGKDL